VLFDLPDYLHHEVIGEVTLALDIEHIGPLFGFGGTGIDARQTDAVFLEGTQQSE
jgi:hypothetical protein